MRELFGVSRVSYSGKNFMQNPRQIHASFHAPEWACLAAIHLAVVGFSLASPACSSELKNITENVPRLASTAWCSLTFERQLDWSKNVQRMGLSPTPGGPTAAARKLVAFEHQLDGSKNCTAHGIEPNARRAHCGRPKVGRIRAPAGLVKHAYSTSSIVNPLSPQES